MPSKTKLDEKWIPNDGTPTINNTIQFFTESVDLYTSKSIYNKSNQLVSEYTSSWIGQVLTPATWEYTSGVILHDPEGENGFATTAAETTDLIVHDTVNRNISKTYPNKINGIISNFRKALNVKKN